MFSCPDVSRSYWLDAGWLSWFYSLYTNVFGNNIGISDLSEWECFRYSAWIENRPESVHGDGMKWHYTTREPLDLSTSTQTSLASTISHITFSIIQCPCAYRCRPATLCRLQGAPITTAPDMPCRSPNFRKWCRLVSRNDRHFNAMKPVSAKPSLWLVLDCFIEFHTFGLLLA